MDGIPSKAAQGRLLAHLRQVLEPVLHDERIPAEYTLKPGLRLRKTYGRCTWHPGGGPPTIVVRCTADGDRTQWRRMGAIVGTLLHEIAHLRYRSHGPRFWALHRRLVDRAAAAGLYDPTDRDPAERGRGDEKLAGSAAWSIALAARQKRLERTRARSSAQTSTAQPMSRPELLVTDFAWECGHRDFEESQCLPPRSQASRGSCFTPS